MNAEAAACARSVNSRSRFGPLDAVPRAIAARDARGLIKLVADRASDQLLCAHMLAPEGAESI